MSDIVERLRAWVYTDSLYAVAVEAADEIERLRSRPCPYVTGTVTRYCTLPNSSETPNSSTLTDAEREAVEYVVHVGRAASDMDRQAMRGLLERLG